MTVNSETTILFCESDLDVLIVSQLLASAGLDDHVEVIEFVSDLPAEWLASLRVARIGVLVSEEIDGQRPPLLAKVRQAFGECPVEGCRAEPCVHAWLFADDLALREHVTGPQFEALAELGPVESIPNARSLAREILGSPGSWVRLLERVDIARACARSTSLSRVLSWVYTGPGDFDPSRLVCCPRCQGVFLLGQRS